MKTSPNTASFSRRQSIERLLARRRSTQENCGFTRTELVAVCAVLLLLGATLLPALASFRQDSKAFVCLNNLQRLTSAWLMYSTDNHDTLMSNPGWLDTSTNTGSYLNWLSDASNTNTVGLVDPRKSLMAPYNTNVRLYKCPADNYQSAANPGPRNRSISLNVALSGGTSQKGHTVPQRTSPAGYNGLSEYAYYFPAGKLTELLSPPPSAVFVMLDEHPDWDDDATFWFIPNIGQTPQWVDLPGSFHNGAGALSFVDGHAQLHQWAMSTTYPSVKYPQTRPGYVTTRYPDADYNWVNSLMPCR